jgi:hypothetical protein
LKKQSIVLTKVGLKLKQKVKAKNTLKSIWWLNINLLLLHSQSKKGVTKSSKNAGKNSSSKARLREKESHQKSKTLFGWEKKALIFALPIEKRENKKLFTYWKMDN